MWLDLIVFIKPFQEVSRPLSASQVKTKAAAAKAAAVKAAAEVKQEIKGAQVERGRNSSARAPQENEQKMPDNSGGYTFVPAMAPFAPAEEAQQAPRKSKSVANVVKYCGN